jgi:hypothetical protein
MSNEQLLGKHKRLREELSAAYAKPSRDTAHIARITSDLAAVEQALALAGAHPVEASAVSDAERPARVAGEPPNVE